jgi:hypothetical protein
MRVYWWQGGVHIEPETDSERDTLHVLTDSYFVDVGHGPHASPPAIQATDQQPIISVHELPEVVP